MRTFIPILAAAAMAAGLSAVALTTSAADEGNSVKTSQPPYKPGREIDESD